MTARELQLDAAEIEDGLAIDEHQRSLGFEPASIDTAEKRLEAWSTAAIGGCRNLVRVDGVLYCWDLQPRRQKNGTLTGRVYTQRKGTGLMRDIGAYKIDAYGRVLQIPAELRPVLPGALEAEPGNDPDHNPEEITQ